MRTKIVAGNWKMNMLENEVIEYILELNDNKDDADPRIEVIIFPPSLFIDELLSLSKTELKIGVQNISQYNNGAYTGELSAQMIKSIALMDDKLEYCMVGHSERREYFGETNEIIAEKVNRVIENDLKVMFCCGEKLEDRRSGKYFEIIKKQIQDSIFQLNSSEIKNVVIAYEPVWAIGTGETATYWQAQEIHRFIRELIKEKYGQEISDKISILYGGSCKPENAVELFAQDDIDGGLIGGASLNVKSFFDIINSFSF